MKRPLSIASLFALFITCGFYFFHSAIAILFVILSLFTVALLKCPQRLKLLFLVTILLFAPLGFLGSMKVGAMKKSLEKTSVNVVMEVYGVKASYGSLKAYGRGSVDSQGFHGKLSDMSLYLKEDGVVSAGDLISFSGKATFKKGGSLNPAVNFSSCEGLKVLPQKRRSLYCFLGKWGDIISRTALNLTEGEITRLFPALLTGNRSWLLPKQEKIISAGGISHLTAVSGMHLAILIYILNLLLGDCNKKLRFFAGNSLCLFAAGISAFTPSVMRAWLLVFLVLLGDCFNRRGDTLTSLGLYGILLCMLRPQWLFNVGAWLSVAAVMGISTFSPLITKGLIELCRVKSDGFWAGLIGVLSVTLSANIATLPIISASFGYISFWSVLSNLFIINLITPVMILLWLAVTLKIAFNIEAPLITYGAVKLSEISMELAEFFGELPPKMLGFSERYIKIFLIFIGIFVFVLVMNEILGKKLMICINFAFISFFAAVILNTFCSMHTVNVITNKDNSCCAVIKNQNVLLIGSVGDSYQRYIMENALRGFNVKKISAVIMDKKDSSGVHQYKLLKEFNCQAILGENPTAKMLSHRSGIPYGELSDGAEFLKGIKINKKGSELTINFKDASILKKGAHCDIIKEELTGLPQSEEIFIIKLHF